ncbi:MULTISPECIES: phage portal protein [Prauserella salsuginis group]|uniref:Phage portal protein n=1 Tax=Prauserella salsuginis TaxID=387889 RepID=A0ABW6G5S8_9PSEU|nr:MULTISPECIES: phage portal protein [Prauserella salsuginis group]MCR3719146.1 Phage portal protein, SPP1 Gp6-like [Prauserella flava]MCR3735841.1 Phage portal protein, SPP1 Gp6-like [Prauserella salsuginis]
MALPQSDEEWIHYLSIQHDAEMPELERLNSHYEGTQPLTYMHPEVLREVEDRIQPVVIAWPQLVVDALEERLDVEGFRLPDEERQDDDLWRVWQANEMDEQSQLGAVDSLVMRRSYVSVGTNEDDPDTPLLAAESPLEMYVDVDPRTRRGRAALRRVTDEDTYARIGERHATLVRPDYTVWYEYGKHGWNEVDRDNHRLGELSVVSLVNRARLSSPRARGNVAQRQARNGQSELAPIIPLSDAANKIATDMMVAAEGVALPLRGFFNVNPDDLQDAEGNQLTAVQALLKKFLTVPDSGEGAREFEFAGANLGGFHESIDALAKRVASLAGLPPTYLGFTTSNPASADAMRSAESRLVKRAERKQRAWGGAYERMCRIVRRLQTGEWDPRMRQLETVWRDASTPTVAQKADAAVKMYTTKPDPIVPLRQTRETIGMTAAQIRRAERDDERRRQQDPLGAIARGMSDGGVPAGVPGGQDGDGDDS